MEKLFDSQMTAIRALNCVIEEGSLSSAAQRLGITASAISKQLTKLENELGVRLLERSTRNVRATAAGREMYNKTKELYEGLGDAVDSVVNAETTVSGRVRISCTPAYGRERLVEILTGLCEEHPLLNFELNLSERNVDFFEDDIDIAIREGALQDSNLRGREIGSSRVVLCASPAYLAQQSQPTNLADLVHHKFLLLPKFGSNTHPSRWFDRNGLAGKINRRIIVNDLHAMRELAERGVGIAGLPVYLIENALSQGTLVQVLPDTAVIKFPINAVYPSNRHMPIRVRLVLDALSRDS